MNELERKIDLKLILSILFAAFLGRAGNMLIILFYIFFACGQGFTMGTTMTNGLHYLPADKSGDGNAVINTLQQLAGAIGTSVVSTIVASAQAATTNTKLGTAIGTHNAFMVIAALSIVTICCSFAAFALSKRYRRIM